MGEGGREGFQVVGFQGCTNGKVGDGRGEGPEMKAMFLGFKVDCKLLQTGRKSVQWLIEFSCNIKFRTGPII